MKFVAAKCPNCGAKLKFEKGKRVYTCDYCRYDLIFDDKGRFDINSMNLDNIDMDALNKQIRGFGKISKKVVLIFSIFFFIVFTFIIVHFFYTFSKINDAISGSNQNENNVTSTGFNFFINNTGIMKQETLSFFLNEVIETINDYNRDVIVEFNGVEKTTTLEIAEIINELDSDDSKYFVSNSKDSDGYIIKIIVNKM